MNGIPLRLVIHCLIMWDKSESSQLFARAAYNEFKRHRGGTVDNLLNSADVAVLLTEKPFLLRRQNKPSRPM